MEYTKDLILSVNYGQAVVKSKRKFEFFERISNVASKHKTMTVILGLTATMMILDFILVKSFFSILISI